MGSLALRIALIEYQADSHRQADRFEGFKLKKGTAQPMQEAVLLKQLLHPSNDKYEGMSQDEEALIAVSECLYPSSCTWLVCLYLPSSCRGAAKSDRLLAN